ncbi:MAG TPA: RNA polymerase sigma factor, partial [Polyangiales bacterium]|nr:RNA polymerase sigma factor [Polyangiales bacterium]
MVSAARELTPPQAPRRDFDALYEQYFDFVWRSLRRLGVREALLEDATQDCYIVVHRRLDTLREDASVKAWLFAIALRVAHNYRRSARRKPTTSLDIEASESAERGPFDSLASRQARETLQRF